MDKKERYLILLHARDYNRGRGIGYGEFFELRPKSMENISIHEMSEIFDKELRLKEGLLKPSDRGRYILTEKGKKELNIYLRKASIKELFHLSKLFPDFGLNYRIKMIEAFIGSILIVFIASLFIYLFQEWFNNHLKTSFTISTLILVFIGVFIVSGITIMSNFIFSLSSSISKSFGKFIEKNINWILPIAIILAIIGGFFALFKFTSLEFKDFINQLIVAIIIAILFSLKNKIPKIKEFCNKIQKR